MFAVAYDSQALISAVQARLSSLLSHRNASAHRGMSSITVQVPELCRPDPSRLPQDSVYWARGGTRDFRLGSGTAVAIHGQGPDRFALLGKGLDTLSRHWRRLDPDGTGLKAQAFVGLTFAPGSDPGDDWLHPGDARLAIPSLLYQRRGPLSGLTFSHHWDDSSDSGQVLDQWMAQLSRLTEGEDQDAGFDRDDSAETQDPLVRVAQTPSESQWLARVEQAVRAIRRETLEKVVLTRSIRVRRGTAISPERLLRWLRTHYPSCTQIAVTGRAQALVAASPERLVSLRGDRLVCDAVAGTAPRGESASIDALLGEELLTSDKARREHRLVVDDVVRALTPLCTGVSGPSTPLLMKLPRIQHLWSPIHARVRPGTSLLRIAERLHPTCAVGGVPRPEALAWLARHEPAQRGWYTGTLGWLDAEGNGDLSVILRCALIEGAEAELFAGAGIVAQSDPREELRETEWKLRTMLDALGAA